MSRSSRLALVLVPLAAATLALTGCQPSGPAEPTDNPVVTPSPTESAPAAATFTLPADCTAIASAVTLNQVFSGVDAVEASPDLVRPAPASAQKQLTCSWFTGDTTGGDIIYYAAPAADSAAYLEVVKANGFSCTEALGGTRCDKTTPNSQFPVDTVETVFTRDGEWIYISTTNVPADPLLPDLVATAWAA
ncbi:MAG TPA: hypothetical protein VL294_07065 [Pseudolysinimonas sp.]|jgi:hypothetical protein|nr:hypothetical protein [Pseudolysinimonas sp.]